MNKSSKGVRGLTNFETILISVPLKLLSYKENRENFSHGFVEYVPFTPRTIN